MIGRPSSPRAAEAVEAIKRLWRAGTPADAAAAVRDDPSIAAIRSLVIDLAYEEYCLREEVGAAPDPSEFAARFPAVQTSLAKVLAGHRELAAHPDLLALPDWPAADGESHGLQLVVELGRGTFGRAYLASDPETQRLCVLKLTTSGVTEARVMARLRHPHVSDVYWANSTGPLAGVCMPFVGGTTLQDVPDAVFRPSAAGARTTDDLLASIDPAGIGPTEVPPGGSVVPAGRPYPIGVAAIGTRIAAGLAHAHRNGLTHGDLKPSNVVLGAGGHPYLIDFNLASDETVADARLGGTLPYMAPEVLARLAGEPTSAMAPAAADLYSLGATLFELLAGRPPFRPTSTGPAGALDLLARIRHERPCIRASVPDVPANLARAIDECLAVNPCDRPADADELRVRLERVLAPSRWFRKAGATVLTATALVTVGTQLRLEPAPPVDTHIARPEPTTPDEHLDRGLEYLHADLLTPALSDLCQARPAPERPLAAAYLAYTMARAGQHENAAAMGRSAIAWGIDTPAVRNNLGYSLIRNGKPDRAVAELTEALRLDPHCRSARFNRAMARFVAESDRGYWQPDTAAAEDMKLALEDGPADATMYIDAACVFAATTRIAPGLRAEALECLAAAAKLGSDPSRYRLEPVLARTLGDSPEFDDLCQRPPRTTTPAPPRHSRTLIEPRPQ